MQRSLVAAALVLGALPACGAIIGIKSLTGDDGADASSSAEAGPVDGAVVDAPALDAGDASCADVTQSADNCGKCGHSCLGGACKSSVCQPVVLATGQGSVAGLTIDAAYVYFTSLSNETVGRVAKSGGKVEILARSPAVAQSLRVAVNGTHVYWVNASPGAISRCPLAGCVGPAEVFASPYEGASVALDGAYVFWADRNAGLVGRKLLDGGPEEVVDVGGFGTIVNVAAAQNGEAFWIADVSGFVGQTNFADGGGYLNPAQNGSSGRDIVVDPTYAYWGAEVNGGDPGKISRTARDGGGVEQLGPANGSPWALAVDSTFVYWTSSLAGDGGLSGGVYACDLAGCKGPPKELAVDQSSPAGIAVDATAIYWGANGVVMKLAKP